MENALSNCNINKVQLKNGLQLTFRTPAEEDAENMIKYLNIVGGESDNLLFGRDEFRLTVEQEKEHIKNVSSNPNILMLLGIVDGNIVCIAQISSSNRVRIAHNSEIAISVKREYWGLGIGSAAMKEMIAFAEKHPVIKNISLGVKASNHTAIKLYEKFGFTKVGIHKNFFNVNGQFDDEILMDLCF